MKGIPIFILFISREREREREREGGGEGGRESYISINFIYYRWRNEEYLNIS